ncbi:peptidoglycan recognition protein [Streptomyces triculaminicus]|uniref:Peptidoglycan recognition protein n=2 Tax=Streptomyces TaxID=1883 RepID=A0A939JPN6_9ACTN|nr:peptidoglycan recognition protein [Streptomyces triculaminicus]
MAKYAQDFRYAWNPRLLGRRRLRRRPDPALPRHPLRSPRSRSRADRRPDRRPGLHPLAAARAARAARPPQPRRRPARAGPAAPEGGSLLPRRHRLGRRRQGAEGPGPGAHPPGGRQGVVGLAGRRDPRRRPPRPALARGPRRHPARIHRPLWVGACDAVEVRVRQEAATGRAPAPPLPAGLRVELVDPGKDPAASRPARRAAPLPAEEDNAASAANLPLAPLGATEIPALARPESARDVLATRVDPDHSSTAVKDAKHTDPDGHGETDPEGEGQSEAPAAPPGPPGPPAPPDPSDSPEDIDDEAGVEPGYYVGPRPRIVTRAGWGADESIREKGFPYDKTVRAAFVHHTASGNGATCAQSASVIRGIYRYHVVSSGWRDIGYNFLVDKCGTVYEGRAGGVAKPVRGAHTLGFNTNSMGIAVLGSFGKANPSAAAVDAVAAITAWKLGLYDINPAGSTTLVSGGGNLFKKGTSVRLKVISGHRDGYSTECPGDRLYKRLGAARSEAARLQGR